MNFYQSRQQGCCLFICACMAVFIAGCETVGNKLAGNQADIEPYQTRKAYRIASPDPEISAAKTVISKPTVGLASVDRGDISPADEGQNESPDIQRIQFEEQASDTEPIMLPPPVQQVDEIFTAAPLAPSADSSPADSLQVDEPEQSYPINLPATLKLAGADNLQIAFAAERVQQAIAQSDAADVLWIPSIRAGLGYNNHAGQIQDTKGDVINVNRSSLFLGGGAGLGIAPLNGGSGGPARMFVDLSPVDVLFEPLAARQAVDAAQSRNVATFNDTLVQAATAYLRLLRAHVLVSISEEAVKNAGELARLTQDHARTGRGLQADAERSVSELESRKRDLLAAREQVAVASAELARILRLDPATQLVPADVVPVPVHLIDETVNVQALIAQAQATRPELSAANADIQETWYRIRQEKLRPWVPHLYAGMSGGGFGGSTGGEIDAFSGRTDFDLAAIWEIQNLGFGNGARTRERESLNRQAHIKLDALRDLVATEVTQAHERVRFRGKQIATTQAQVKSATEALALNLDGIRGGVVRPIELQQAISALASARRQHVDAVLQHNQAQFELLRAVGQPPEL